MKVDQAKRPGEYKPDSFMQQQRTEALGRLVEVYDATGQKDRAAEWRKELEAAIDQQYAQVEKLFRERNWYAAEPILLQVVAARRKLLPAGHPKITDPVALLGVYRFFQKKYAEAEKLLREAITAMETEKLPGSGPRLFGAKAWLGMSLQAQKKHAEAEPLLREAITAMEKEKAPDAVGLIIFCKASLGGCLLAQKKHAEAEPFLLAAVEGMKADQAKRPGEYKPGSFMQQQRTEALGRLVEVYDATGQKDRAAEWRKELEASRAGKRVEKEHPR
jgi:hypothetical protein